LTSIVFSCFAKVEAIIKKNEQQEDNIGHRRHVKLRLDLVASS